MAVLVKGLIYIKIFADDVMFRILMAKKTPDTNPFNYIKNNKVSGNTNIRETAASWYGLMKTLGIIGMVVSLIIIGIMFMSKDARKRQEAKENLLVKGGIFVAICAFVWLIGSVASVISKLV